THFESAVRARGRPLAGFIVARTDELHACSLGFCRLIGDGSGVDGMRSATVSVRDKNGVVLDDQPWPDASLDVLATAMPWRTFRWRQGQKHYSGVYWSSVQGDHVIYESRLELAVLLLTD